MIEVHKVRGEVYCDCCATKNVSQSGSTDPRCKQRATVRITAANFSACNPTNIVLCEDCLKELKGKIDYFLSSETHPSREMISLIRELNLCS